MLKNDGNAYRSTLERLVDRLGLDNHVVFHNRFVTLEELLGYIGVAEIYITPIRTSSRSRRERWRMPSARARRWFRRRIGMPKRLLADGRGRIFPFGDTDALADNVNELLGDDASTQRNPQHGAISLWPCR